MSTNKKGLTRREVRPEKKSADEQRGQLQYSQPSTPFQDFEQYKRAVRQCLADAFVMSREFPAKLRFSYVVDRHGRLRCLTERRAAG